jgi:hypothetical protein
MTTRSHEHARPAEIKPDSTIFTQRSKIGDPIKPKIYSKVLGIIGIVPTGYLAHNG